MPVNATNSPSKPAAFLYAWLPLCLTKKLFIKTTSKRAASGPIPKSCPSQFKISFTLQGLLFKCRQKTRGALAIAENANGKGSKSTSKGIICCNPNQFFWIRMSGISYAWQEGGIGKGVYQTRLRRIQLCVWTVICINEYLMEFVFRQGPLALLQVSAMTQKVQNKIVPWLRSLYGQGYWNQVKECNYSACW